MTRYDPAAQILQVAHTVLEVELHAEATYCPAPHVEQDRGLGEPIGQKFDTGHGNVLDALGQNEPAGHRADVLLPAGQ